MKKSYVAPCLEIEVYTLSTSIAANCTTPVDAGPDTAGRKDCDDFDDLFDMNSNSGISLASEGASFYDSDPGYCDCYYTTGSGGYFTS